MDDPTPTVLDSERLRPAPAMSLQRYMTLVGWGLLVTTLGQTKSIGRIPLNDLLKNHMLLSATVVASFVELAAAPWSFKFIAGFVVDAFPLFGSRRRYYLMLSSLGAGILWLAMAIVPRTYLILLTTAFAFNVLASVASVVIGGLLVEGAQAHGATGRFSSLRLVLINVTYLLMDPIGGRLAERPFFWTTIVGGALFLSMVPVTLLLLRETPPERRPDEGADALSGAWMQLKNVGLSKTLWITGALLFLVQVAPGLGTPLYYYQTDTLKLSNKFIGNLGFLYGGMGLIASFVYPFFCRRFRLRTLLALAIVCTVASNLAYLGYRSRNTAMIVEGAAGLGLTLAQLPLFDIASRATPRGSEALAYSLMITCWNLGLMLSNLSGGYLYDHFNKNFLNLVWVNAGTTALVLVVVPFLPGHLVDRREGEGVSGP